MFSEEAVEEEEDVILAIVEVVGVVGVLVAVAVAVAVQVVRTMAGSRVQYRMSWDTSSSTVT